MSRYFVVAIGRSGTAWLSSLLNQAQGHVCAHEEGDHRDKVTPQPWAPFPVERWDKSGRASYGEVNGMLRYHLSGQCLGREMEIPCRVYLRRNPLDIVASWMVQGGRAEWELSATCAEVLWHAQNLTDWARLSDSLVVEAEDLWRAPAAVQALVDWLGLRLTVTTAMMSPRNTGNAMARQAWIWTPERIAVARRAAERMGWRGTLSPGKENPVWTDPEI